MSAHEAAQAAENSDGLMSMIQGLKHGYIEGGVWMHPIAVIQIITLAIILERVFIYYVLYALNLNKFVSKCVQFLREKKIEECLKYVQGAKRHPIAKVTLVGLNRLLAKCDVSEIQSKMDELLLQYGSVYETRLSYLASFGNVASMFGLLGTVAGMIKSFAAVAHAAPADKAALLASGIAESMNATAYGMIVGIPAIMAFTILQAQSAHKTADLNNAAVAIFNTIAYEVLENSGHAHGQISAHTSHAATAVSSGPAKMSPAPGAPAARPGPPGTLAAKPKMAAAPGIGLSAGARPAMAAAPKAAPGPAPAARPGLGPLKKAVGK